MARTAGAQIGLLAFAVAIVAGLYAGNPPTVILARALWALLLGALIGHAAGWACKLVLRDYLQRRKLAVDREHMAAVRALAGALPAVAEATEAAETEAAAPAAGVAAPAEAR